MAIDENNIVYISDGENTNQEVLNRPTKDLVNEVDSELGSLDSDLKQYADSGDSDTLSSAKSYSDSNDGISNVSVTGDGNSSIDVTVEGNDGSSQSNSTSTSHDHDGRYYTQSEIDSLLAERTPSGGIIMWSGGSSNIPTGWVLCDGNNGTPDLRNRFIVGAGGAYADDETGGSKDAVVVSHSHSGSTTTDGNHGHSGSTSTGGSHYHHIASVDQVSPSGNSNLGSSNYLSRDVGASNTYDSYALRATSQSPTVGRSSSTGNHNHSLNVNSNGNHNHSLNINSTGESGTNKNLPPYYALAFIMKL